MSFSNNVSNKKEKKNNTPQFNRKSPSYVLHLREGSQDLYSTEVPRACSQHASSWRHPASPLEMPPAC